MGIKRGQRPRSRTWGRDRRRCCRSGVERKCAGKAKVVSPVWIKPCEQDISHFRSSKIIKNTESSAKYHLPPLILRNLVGDSYTRRDTRVWSVEWWSSDGRKRQLGQVLQVKPCRRREIWPINCRWGEVHVPSEAVG